MPSATTLKVTRTTAFKLALAYLVVFGIFVTAILGYIGFQTTILMADELRGQLHEEFSRLERDFRRGGIIGLRRAIDARTRRPGPHLYLLVSRNGVAMAGNLSELPAGALDEEGLIRFDYRQVRPDEDDDDEGVVSSAIGRVVFLPAGHKLFVGRDVGDREAFRQALRRGFFLAGLLMLLLAAFGWWFIRRRVLLRLEEVGTSSRAIMAGDLSQRLPLAGTGDEFDRLAETLNVMLARIEELMLGLKEVSDNIAHDLKTPLTRMRTRIEAALRADPQSDRDREALTLALSDCDQMIATFQALLLIARVEAGSTHQVLANVDAGEIAADVVDLMQPIAEEEGVALNLGEKTEQGVMMAANRELVAQTLTNLVDNAIKYARSVEAPAITLSVEEVGGAVRLSVADNGPGIPAAERERVLQRFVRLDPSRTEPGSGLGLALVGAIATFHRGAISLEDAGPGLRAVLTIPAARPLETGGAS